MESTTTPAELPGHVAAALAAWHAGDPDAAPRAEIRAAWRDLSCRQTGPEVYRQVVYAGQTCPVWPEADRLPPQGSPSAGARHAVSRTSVPVGTLVLSYRRQVWRGKRGRCTPTFGLVALDGDRPALVAVPHRTLRARPAYEVTLPDGTTVCVPRREVA